MAPKAGDLGPLRTGQSVAVVGGGPAGTAAAIALRRRGEALGRDIRVTLFEPRDFHTDGNVCVGVVSPPFGRLLAGLGLSLPAELVQRRIERYILHTDSGALELPNPPDAYEPTLALRRLDLDRFMLASARDAGAELRRETVTDLRIEREGAMVCAEGGVWERFDAVVCAFGLGGHVVKALENATGYRRPPLMRALLAVLPLGREVVEQYIGNDIHALLLASQPQIEFAALTPKADHVTVNAAGPRILESDLAAVIRHLQHLGLLPGELPAYRILHNVFPSGPASGFFADRVVAVGNTSGLLRPLKGKGLSTGLLTAERAAKVMLEEGISGVALRRYFEACADLRSDYRYGLLLRGLFRLSRRLGYLDPVIALARHDRRLYRVFHTMVSGEGSYKQVVLSLAHPGVWPGIARIALGVERSRWFAGHD